MSRLALVLLTVALAGCTTKDAAVSQPAPAQPAAQALPSAGGKFGWPMFGGTPARNMANAIDKGIPTDWSVEPGKQKNIKWQAELGSKTYGGPIVARGKVYVGANNMNPRDKKLVDDKGKPLSMAVVMAFDEATGKFLWQNAHLIPNEEVFHDIVEPHMGLLSTPAVDGDRIFYVLPQCIVVCANADTGKIDWEYDMRRELKVVPFHCSNCSPLVVGDRVFVITGNGTDMDGKVASPEAPSFIALTKKGELAWKSSLPGKNILEGQWSNPAYAVINGKPQVIFPGGDAVIYSFEPETGKLIWKFQCPRLVNKKDDALDNYIVATPVIYDNKVFVGMGQYPDNPRSSPYSWFLCIDAARTGDISPTAQLNPNVAENKGSGGLVWAYGGIQAVRPKRGRSPYFSCTISTAAIHDGLVYIAEEAGYVNCLDAKTGKKQWVEDLQEKIWGSPYYVDGHVFLETESEVVVFQAASKLKVIGKIDVDERQLHGTPVAAGGVLFFATPSKLYAIARKE